MLPVDLAVELTLQATAMISWQIPQASDPSMRCQRRPINLFMAIIPRTTPTRPTHVLMTVYWKGLAMPAIVKK